MSLRQSVQAAVESVADPRDRAAVDLALTYAGQLDDGGDLAKLGPALLATLEALQLSPRARKAATSGDKSASQLDQLAGRRARKGRAPDLDAAAT